jgi:hypothetical protein
MLRVTVPLLIAMLTGIAYGAEFRTNDPLKAFIQREIEFGDDYFINGNKDTYIFRCTLTKQNYKFEGIALSEISIWGNRTGPWEVFRKNQNGRYVYIGTEYLTDTACLEHCRSKEYLTSGRCKWEHGWPRT